MLVVNYSVLRSRLKTYFDKITDEQETVIVTRKDNKNVVMISLDEYNRLNRLIRNAEYYIRLNDQLAKMNKEAETVLNLDKTSE